MYTYSAESLVKNMLWMADNYWLLTDNRHIKARELLECINYLEKLGCYELILVMILRADTEQEVHGAMKVFAEKHLRRFVERNGFSALLAEFKEILTDEIRKQEDKEEDAQKSTPAECFIENIT